MKSLFLRSSLLFLISAFFLVPCAFAQLPPAAPITVKVAVVIQDPLLPQYGNKRMHEVIKTPGRTFMWNDPYALNKEYEEALETISHGVVQYEVVKVIDDGKFFSRRNDNNEMVSTDEMVRLLMEPEWKTLKETGTHFDYKAFVEYYGFDEMRDRNEINEVWVWSFPYGGMWESNYCGADGFWLNSDPTTSTRNEKLLVVMGLNYERKMSLALESYGHRFESVMWHLYGRWNKDATPPNNWELYTQYDKTHPGEAHIGNIHFPPNGVHDYDWVNKTVVSTHADAWQYYPGIPLEMSKKIDCQEWDCSHLGYMSWWFSHIPHFSGLNPNDGHLNNWWHYVVNWEEAIKKESDETKLSMIERSRSARIYFLEMPGSGGKELSNAKSFLENRSGFQSSQLVPDQIQNIDPGNDPMVLWFHLPDSLLDPGRFYEFYGKPLKAFVEKGGNLLLTLDAMRLLPFLGLEKEKPEISYTNAIDEGYGRKMGWHAFRSHPVYDSLLGGAYVFAPKQDMMVRRVGYFGNTIPEGKVVGVDWAYIFLHEDNKMITEYTLGKGKVLAIGSYLLFGPENYNQKHLELFTRNVFRYLTGYPSGVLERHWDYTPGEVKEVQFSSPRQRPGKPSKWELYDSDIALQNPNGNLNSWDIAGERMLVMGQEGGGIEEVWAHPFMALRDLHLRYKFQGDPIWNSIESVSPEIEVTPVSFNRLYHLKDATLREMITVHPSDPSFVLHYEYEGKQPVEINFTMKCNQRFMWPYSERVTGDILFGWDDGLQAWVVRDRSGEHITVAGLNKKPSSRMAQPDQGLMAVLQLSVQLDTVDVVDFCVATSATGLADADEEYRALIRNPGLVYQAAIENARSLFDGKLSITGRDEDFNVGYKWAIAASDRFVVNTPGIGRSLVAGYATSAHGWNGGHKVNGRPGYAWYFGRDAVWSGFALLDYGDYEKVKTILKLFADYQDISGKIYHELTTSGIAHYDAADATPLYLVLAGKYLHHSGDLEFITQLWPSLKKAIDFCFTTDTDGDHLIENTQQGHGWEEGGDLYGTHVTQYMVSCWAEALSQSAYMANALGFTTLAGDYLAEWEVVIDKLNRKFWNPETQFFNHGVYKNDSYLVEPSVMTAIPVYWHQINDPLKSLAVMNRIGSCNFTTDWGTRIVSETASFFGPGGYHTGSVWPLFTGWAALGDFAIDRIPQGYAKMMSNLLEYRSGALGYVPEVLHGSEYKPFGVCKHQCWSETMVLQPAIEGMLGLEADALSGTAVIRANFPLDWDHVEVDNIRIGNELFGLLLDRSNRETRVVLSRKSSDEEKPDNSMVAVKLVVPLLRNSMLERIEEDGESRTVNAIQDHFEVSLGREASQIVVVAEYTGGISVLPVVSHPEPISPSKGIRIIDEYFLNGVYSVKVEGLSGTSGEIRVLTGGGIPDAGRGLRRAYVEGHVLTYRFKFSKSDAKYSEKVLDFIPKK